MAKQLKFTIGLPFSGKSTLAKEYAQAGWEIISRDQIQQVIVMSSEFQVLRQEIIERLKPQNEEELFGELNRIMIKKITEAVAQKVRESDSEKFFYDGPNLQNETRRALIEALIAEGVEVSAVYLKASMEQLIERARRAAQSGERLGSYDRGAFVNLEKMSQLFEEPDASEGIVIETADFNKEPAVEIEQPKYR
jgi:predicted kinase